MTKKNILIGCTGSVATIKLKELIEALLSTYDCAVGVVLTEKAGHFVDLDSILLTGALLYRDEDEWSAWQGRGDPVLHVDLTKWADVFVVAPLDANSLGKIASGLCDNLLLCIVRAWNLEKPLLFAPAMNTMMWDHPITAEQIEKLCNWGYQQIPPIAKTLMCGDTGIGAMASVDTIVQSLMGYLIKKEI